MPKLCRPQRTPCMSPSGGGGRGLVSGQTLSSAQESSPPELYRSAALLWVCELLSGVAQRSSLFSPPQARALHRVGRELASLCRLACNAVACSVPPQNPGHC